MANVLGKRYMCEKCGTEVLCNKAGPGSGLECCDVEMKIKEKGLSGKAATARRKMTSGSDAIGL